MAAFQFPKDPPDYQTVENPITGSTYQWRPEFNKWVLTGQAQSGGSQRGPIFSDTEPDKHPDLNPPQDELIAGDIWYNTTNPDQLGQYIYDGTQWIEYSGQFVRKKGGDLMEGPLTISGQRNATVDDPPSTLVALNVDSGQDSDLQLRHHGQAKVYVGATSVSVNPKVVINDDIELKRNNIKVRSQNTKKEIITLNDNGAFYDGNITADNHMINKEYSDLEDQILDAKVTELRIELDALAPIDASGIYRWQNAASARPPAQGQFILLTEDLSQTVQQYNQSNAVWIHQTDWESNFQDFTDVHVGELIQLFDRYEPEFVLGEITAVEKSGLMPDYSGSLIIKYTRIRSNGAPQYASGADPLVNFKVYRKPTDDGTGNTAYLPIKGGEMQGNIVMDANKIKFNAVDETTDHLHFTREPGEFAHLLRLDNPGGATNGGYDVRLTGNSSYNRFRLCAGSNGDVPKFEMRANNGLGDYLYFHDSVNFTDNNLNNVGDAVNDDQAVNLGQVRAALSELRDEFIESLVAGVWKSDNFTGGISSTGVGSFATRQDGGATAATNFAHVDLIRFWYEDEQGISVEWDNWDPGELITLRQFDNPSVYAVYRIKAPVQINGNIRNIQVQYIKSQNDSDHVFPFGERYAISLTEFTDGFNGGELDNLYLRLDGTSKMEGDLDLNRHQILNPSNIDLRSNGHIRVNNKNAIKFYAGTSTSAGFGRVQIERPEVVTRSLVIRGREPDSTYITDMFYAYHPDSDIGDVVIYKGRTSSDQSIQTKESVEALINQAYIIDEEGDIHFYDHRLEDVGAPVAATDAATKGYTDYEISILLEKIEALEERLSNAGL
nr:hypothetical protein 82 [Pelagibacteraceae bacterium]